MAIASENVEAWSRNFEGFVWMHAVATASPRALVATILTIHVIVVVLLAVPEFRFAAVTCTTSLGHIVWNHVFSPSPPTPAGGITMSVIRSWSNHIIEVEFPRLRQAK